MSMDMTTGETLWFGARKTVSAGELSVMMRERIRKPNPGVLQAAHKTITVSVAIAGQPTPPVQDGRLYREFMAYRRLGRYVASGVWA